ncbi:MAG TPA: helix-turn-helix transcriptional regulator [Anaerolineaceae bacterium]|jgi:DNA-binding NarL/FixJ family response regulator
MTLVIFLGPSQRLTIFEDPAPPARLAAQINAGKMTLAYLSLKSGQANLIPSPCPSILARQIGDYVVVSDPAAFNERQTRQILSAARLSPRERQVLRSLANGATTQQIALELHIKERTVRAYTNQLKNRLEAQNLAQLVGRAVMMGII